MEESEAQEAIAGLWVESVDPITGESSLRTHTPRKIWQRCTSCIYDTFIPPSREISCLVCGQSVRFIVGMHRINEDGTMHTLSPDKT